MLGLWNRRLLALALVPTLGCGVDVGGVESGGASDSATDGSYGTTTGEGSSGQGDSDNGGTSSASGTSGTSSGGTTAATSEPSETEGETGESLNCFEPEDGKGECCYPLYELAPFGAIPAIVEVTIDLTVNGGALPEGAADAGDVFLVSKDKDRIFVGRTTFGELKARVFAGTYDLVYESRARGDVLPWNARVTLVEGIDVGESPVIEHDIKVVRAEGTVLVNGAAPPMSPLDDADLFVVDPASGAKTLIARTSLLGPGGAFSANLVPETYEVRYAARARKDVMPYNTESRLDPLEVPAIAAEGQAPPLSPVAPIAIDTVVLAGDILFDGATPPTSLYDHGRLYLRDHATESVVLLADTALGAIYDVPVIAHKDARYDVVYGVVAHQAMAPLNEWATVRSELDAETLKSELQSFVLDTVSVSGSFAIDGAPPVNDPSNEGEVILGAGVGGDRALIGGIVGELSGVILAGSYDAFFRHNASDGGLPVNTRGRVASDTVDVVDGAPPLDLAVQTALLSGAFTLSGSTPPTSAYDTGRIFLRSADGDVVHLGFTSDLAYQRRVIRGSYGVYYAAQTSGAKAPANRERWLMDMAIEGDLEQAIDVPGVAVSVDNPLALDGPGRGRVYLRELTSGDELFVGTTMTGTLAATLIPGNYRLVYRVDLAGDGVAANDGVSFGCLHVE